MRRDTMRRVQQYKSAAVTRRSTREYQRTQLRHLIQANKRRKK